MIGISRSGSEFTQEKCAADFGDGNIAGMDCALFHSLSVGGLLFFCVHENLLEI